MNGRWWWTESDPGAVYDDDDEYTTLESGVGMDMIHQICLDS